MKKTRMLSIVMLMLIVCVIVFAVSGSSNSNYIQNNVAIPLSDYPATPGTGWTRPTVLKRFLNSDGSLKEYGGSNECDGFARYAHDTFWHMDDSYWDGLTWNKSNADYHGAVSFNSSTTTVKNFFTGLKRGAFIRYISKTDSSPANGTHSIFFDGINAAGDGIWAYECNMDGNCGVHYQNYTFAQIASYYSGVLYYVDHDLNEPAFYDMSYHSVDCVNCEGYALQAHTGQRSYQVYSATQHKVAFSCCERYVLQSHNGQSSYQVYSATQHTVTFSCCEGAYYMAHTFPSSGTNARCSQCGAIRGAVISSTDEKEIR